MAPCRHPKQQSLSREAGGTFLEPEVSLLFSQAPASGTCFSQSDRVDIDKHYSFNLSEPCVLYIGRAYRYPPDVAFYIYIFFNNKVLSILNILNALRFSLQNAVYFIMLPLLVPILFTFYKQVC